MAIASRRRWVIPACLAVTTLLPLACEDDDGGGDEGSSASTSTGPSPTSDTGSQVHPCYAIETQEACEGDSQWSCLWDPALEGACVPYCPGYPDQASCEMDDSCAWIDNMCGEPVI